VYCPVPTEGLDAGAPITDPNVVAVTVDPGPQNIGYVDGIFASVTFCVPGGTDCQTIDHLLVDTGSVGVRVLESELTLALPDATGAAGQLLVECMPFVDGTAWGPIKTADVKIGGEIATGLPIQLIGEKAFTLPSACTGTPITDFESLAANGILGVGSFLQDCGTPCAQPARSASNPGLYFTCSGQTGPCAVASVPVAQQVAHPVAAFPEDNNGVIIQLPSLPEGGAFSVPGLLVFGIGTQANNGLGGAKVFPLDAVGFMGTAFPVGGPTYTSYIDSGSNGLFFLNTATTKLKLCGSKAKDFYCPSVTTNLSATILGSDGTSADVSFRVANAINLDLCSFAFDALAGPMPGFPTDPRVPGFDWGLPFFFGRSVYTAIENRAAEGNVGPFFAF
jgi:hypothetical protein